MNTNVKFKIVIVNIEETTPKEKRDEAVQATALLFDDYPDAEVTIVGLTVGIYRIEKIYCNELS